MRSDVAESNGLKLGVTRSKMNLALSTFGLDSKYMHTKVGDNILRSSHHGKLWLILKDERRWENVSFQSNPLNGINSDCYGAIASL